MAEGTIRLPNDGTGKEVRTVTNAGVAGGAHQEVGTVAHPDGTLVGDTAPFPVRPRGTAVSGTPTTATATTQTTVHTPASGKRIRLRWLGLKTPTGAADTVVTVRLGTTIIYSWPLTAPDVFSHSSVREGAVDSPLTVQLSVASTVYVNLDVEEF